MCGKDTINIRKTGRTAQKKGGIFQQETSFVSKKSRTVDVIKLRMTGFECFAAFVIRRAKHTPKGAARHWRQELCLGIKNKLDEFPNQTVRLNPYVYLLSVTKIDDSREMRKKNA